MVEGVLSNIRHYNPHYKHLSTSPRLSDAVLNDIMPKYRLFAAPTTTTLPNDTNLFDEHPVPMPQTTTGIDVDGTLYDLVGRMLRLGVHVNL
jgi:hypothetical protein